MRDFRTWIAKVEAQQFEVGLSLAWEFQACCEAFNIPEHMRMNHAIMITQQALLLMAKMYDD